MSVCGVKRNSAFADLVDGLSLTAGNDYMHCVLFGVSSDILGNLFRSMNRQQKFELKQWIDSLNAPREVMKHARKDRRLRSIAFFKANEFFNYLIFVGLFVLGKFPNEELFIYAMKVVMAIRLLLESCDEDDPLEADAGLMYFCKKIESAFDSEKLKTINVHIKKHLVPQCRDFRPLFVLSSMAFEAANRKIGDYRI